MAIRQGITPTFTLTLQSETLDLTQSENVYCTFKQGASELTKTDEDLTVRESEVDVYLTQTETLMFNRGFVSVQLNWIYADGSRGCSEIVPVEWADNLLRKELE